MRIYITIFFIYTHLLGCAQPKVFAKFTMEKRSTDERVIVNMENSDSIKYWYHVQISRKIENDWVSIIGEGQKDFFKTGYLDLSSSKTETFSILHLQKHIEGQKEIKFQIIFTPIGVHLSKSKPLFSPEYIVQIPRQ